MAVLDPRLLPLIETLAAVGADWLAFEIIDGIRLGREPEEPETLLALARERVRLGEPGERGSTKLPRSSDPILGDDQVTWAAKYVLERIDSALADLSHGSAFLEAIVEATPSHRPSDQPEDAETDRFRPIKIAIVDQEDGAIDRESIETARSGLQDLRQALETWSLAARSTSQT